MTLNEIIHKAVMAGLGVPEKMKEIVDELVKKGELSESQGSKLVKEWKGKLDKSSEDLGKSVSDVIKKTLEKMNIPTRDEVEKLEKKITALSARVKKLETSSEASE